MQEPTGPEAEGQPSSNDAQLSPEVEEAIQKDLAAAAAVALLAKTDHAGDSRAPAMKCIGAGAALADDPDCVRIQFVFENGTVLPIDIPHAAGQALARALTTEPPV